MTEPGYYARRGLTGARETEPVVVDRPSARDGKLVTLRSNRMRLDSRVAFRLKSGMPPGTSAVGLGLVVTGVAAYGYLVLTARVLGSSRYVPLSVLWAAVFVLGPGLFLPLQQEVGRLYAHRALEKVGGGPVFRRAALAGCSLVVAVLVVLGALSKPIDHRLFERQPLLLLGLACALVGYLLLSLLWGCLAGSGRFGHYAVAQSLDAGLRLALCVALAVLGVKTAGPYGLLLGLTPIAAALAVFLLNTDLLEPGPPAAWADLSSALGWLLVGSIGAQLLANGPVIAVKLLASSGQQQQAGTFLAGLIVARVPLFLFGAVQAALLPRLAALAKAGEYRQFRIGLNRLVGVVVAIAALATALSFAIGPFLVSSVFGHGFTLGRTDVTLLTAASGLYMLVLALVQPLIALGYHARSAIGWITGLAALAVATEITHGLLRRVEWGFFSGALVALLAAGLLLWKPLRSSQQLLDPDKLEIAASRLEVEP